MFTESAIEKNNRLELIDKTKLFLILGILFIHSTPNYNVIPTEYNCIGRMIDESVHRFCTAAVPCFFIVSGYLFFINFKRFDIEKYYSKLGRRIRTLFVPYVLWNIICCALLYFKVRFLGQSGLGVFTPEGVDWPNFFKGFIYIPEAQNMPYAFAFWFIRNLMAFVCLAPLVRVVASRLWIVIALFVFLLIFCLSLQNLQWFILGAWFGIKGVDFNKLGFLKPYRYCLLVLTLGLAAIHTLVKMPPHLAYIVYLTVVLLAFVIAVLLGLSFSTNSGDGMKSMLVQSTFFLFAFHQLFVTKANLLAIKICGESNVGVVFSMLLTFIILLSVSFCVFLIFRRWTPRLLAILTGGRA